LALEKFHGGGAVTDNPQNFQSPKMI